MNEIALPIKHALSQDDFDVPEEDVIPLHWSVLIWLALSAGSWALVIFVGSFFF